jgi:molybdenum cofactor biosynthesis enzyme MoaA
MMKSNNFSIVVGGDECNANCPYCVAKMTGQCGKASIDMDRLDKACMIAKGVSTGLLSTLLTGKGEPMLYPDQIGYVLQTLQRHKFPLVGLQTNGTLIEKNVENLKRWRTLGLDLVCISITSAYGDTSNDVMGIKGSYRYWKAVDTLHDLGFSVRLNCTMTNVGLNTTGEFNDLVDRCQGRGVAQLTLREVERPFGGSGPIVDWVKKNKPEGFAKRLHHYIEMHGGVRLLELPHGGVVYNYDDQNVCVTNCLTGSTDPDNTRQIIYFPDGRIMYDWRFAGARIL